MLIISQIPHSVYGLPLLKLKSKGSNEATGKKGASEGIYKKSSRLSFFFLAKLRTTFPICFLYTPNMK